MIARVAPFAIGLALVAVPADASSGGDPPRIAFATNRAQNLYRVGIYSVRPDGYGRRLVALPTPPATSLVRSRDGSRILTLRNVGGTSGLFVSRPSGDDAVRIGPARAEEGVDLTRSAFSPDGRKVAYTGYTVCGWRCVNNVLYVANVDGTGLQVVDEHGYDPSWAPDSRRLVYVAPGVSRPAIRVFDTEGRTKRVLASGYTYRPSWSPRGERIAYLVTRGGYTILCFVQANGTRQRCRPGISASRIVWSPDARRVAVQLQQRTYRVAVVDPDAHLLRVFSGGRISLPLAWSPDGRRLAYSSGISGDADIFVRAVGGSASPSRVTHEPTSTFFGDVRWRAGRISYVAYLGSNDFELAISDGERVRVLTHNDVDDREPAWSPDGRTIVYSRAKGQSSADTSRLRLIDSGGRNDRALTGSGRWRDTDPAWSPDGSRVAFIRMDSGSMSLMVINRDGSGLRPVTSTAVLAGGVSWAPDGSSLVVPAAAGELLVAAVDGSGSRRLVTWRSRPTAPAWSPDGTRILFAADGGVRGVDDRPDLFTIGPEGTGLARIAEAVAFLSPGGSWSPDGSRIAFARSGDRYSYPTVSRIVVGEAGGGGGGEVDVVDDRSLNLDAAWSR